jgi:nucleoside-diphosphate-sugar epimerase
VEINVIEERDEFRPLRGALSIEKAKKVLGYDPQFSLDKGLEVYVETYKKLGVF